MSGEVRLDDSSIQAIAIRVAKLLREETVPAAPRLVDAGEVARRFGLTRNWVYEHAAELGALRLGDGPRGRLRFDLAKVVESLTVCSDSRGSEASGAAPRAKPRCRRRSQRAESAGLLPIRPVGGAQ